MRAVLSWAPNLLRGRVLGEAAAVHLQAGFLAVGLDEALALAGILARAAVAGAGAAALPLALVGAVALHLVGGVRTGGSGCRQGADRQQAGHRRQQHLVGLLGHDPS